MAHADELLRAYARMLGRLSGAGCVTLFVPASGDDPHPLLVHEGDLEPTPELGDPDTAAAMDRSAPTAAVGAGPRRRPILRESTARECRLIQVPLGSGGFAPETPAGPAEPARRRGDEPTPRSRRRMWIGLRFAGDRGPFAGRSGAIEAPFAAPDPEDPALWNGILGLAATLAGHSRLISRILHDPVTGLPGRAELQEELHQAMSRARETERPLALLLVNPDDFNEVNDRYGRETGDRVLQEVANRLRTTVRRTDLVGKFGGAIFTCLLRDTSGEQAHATAGKVLDALSRDGFLTGHVSLTFSIGVAAFEPADRTIEGSLDLIWRADQALNAAKRAGGARLKVWQQGSDVESSGNLDRLTGIFTGNMAKDYRNMTLLWDSVNAVAAGAEHHELAEGLIKRLHAALKPRRTTIFLLSGDGELRPLVGRPGNGAAPDRRQTELMGRACSSGRAVASEGGVGDADPEGRVAVPMRAGDATIGCLWLEGIEGVQRPDSSDLVFLQALASQMAVALDRARLAEREHQRQEQERSRLKAEVEELRRAIQASKLAYRSSRMEELLATARRIAPTDATVLITGESGTGKELLARTIHELSARREQPLIVVDCGAIASTLIDSELFGHLKGAFTGAQERKVGRLAEADGATVLLDEIGELPLEVQTKLLRFVQERQLTPVGGSKPRTVDVRIIAATNQDLAARVRDGRFREDLYYRLNVVRLSVPPLRDRPEDVLFLAEHFLEKYAATYAKDARRLAPEAAELLVDHDWPGNVRELQNRVMQAVLLSDGVELGAGDFRGINGGVRAGFARPTANEPEVPRESAETATAAVAGGAGTAPAALVPPATSDERPLLDRLREALARQIESALSGDARASLPLGTWLEEDLVLAADASVDNIARRGAQVLGIPETTYRRRLQKTAGRDAAGLLPRPITWDEVRRLLAALVRSPQEQGENLLERTQRVLLDEIVARVPDDTRTSAALLGVTPPTLKRRLAAARS